MSKLSVSNCMRGMVSRSFGEGLNEDVSLKRSVREADVVARVHRLSDVGWCGVGTLRGYVAVERRCPECIAG